MPDIINVDVGGVTTVFDYTDSLPILEALTISGLGSTLLTLQSIDNDGIDVPVGPLSLYWRRSSEAAVTASILASRISLSTMSTSPTRPAGA